MIVKWSMGPAVGTIETGGNGVADPEGVAMIDDPGALIRDFRDAALLADLRSGHSTATHELHLSPHKPPALPLGKCAVYVFSLSGSYGSRCPAGPNRVLKVGRVGPNSSARFSSQHYYPSSAPSNLAATLLKATILWPFLGITELSSLDVAHWIKSNTDRDHFFLNANDNDELRHLERYIRGRLGPVFEGG